MQHVSYFHTVSCSKRVECCGYHTSHQPYLQLSPVPDKYPAAEPPCMPTQGLRAWPPTVSALRVWLMSCDPMSLRYFYAIAWPGVFSS